MDSTLFSGASNPNLVIWIRPRNRSEAIAELISPEMTYIFAQPGVTRHILELKVPVPVMIIRNVLHPHLVNGKTYTVKRVNP